MQFLKPILRDTLRLSYLYRSIDSEFLKFAKDEISITIHGFIKLRVIWWQKFLLPPTRFTLKRYQMIMRHLELWLHKPMPSRIPFFTSHHFQQAFPFIICTIVVFHAWSSWCISREAGVSAEASMSSLLIHRVFTWVKGVHYCWCLVAGRSLPCELLCCLVCWTVSIGRTYSWSGLLSCFQARRILWLCWVEH